ncbi:MAG: hypothetical protein GY715_13050 [Planctomycetes bacterium]|nr:hypothetical protein [Planctomycetota bacterium]
MMVSMFLHPSEEQSAPMAHPSFVTSNLAPSKRYAPPDVPNHRVPRRTEKTFPLASHAADALDGSDLIDELEELEHGLVVSNGHFPVVWMSFVP